jgi:hypothetical protein
VLDLHPHGKQVLRAWRGQATPDDVALVQHVVTTIMDGSWLSPGRPPRWHTVDDMFDRETPQAKIVSPREGLRLSVREWTVEDRGQFDIVGIEDNGQLFTAPYP